MFKNEEPNIFYIQRTKKDSKEKIKILSRDNILFDNQKKELTKIHQKGAMRHI